MRAPREGGELLKGKWTATWQMTSSYTLRRQVRIEKDAKQESFLLVKNQHHPNEKHHPSSKPYQKKRNTMTLWYWNVDLPTKQDIIGLNSISALLTINNHPTHYSPHKSVIYLSFIIFYIDESTLLHSLSLQSIMLVMLHTSCSGNYNKSMYSESLWASSRSFTVNYNDWVGIFVGKLRFAYYESW